MIVIVVSLFEFSENAKEHRAALRQGRRPDRPDKDHAETSMPALRLLRSALVHGNTLLLQQVLAEPRTGAA
ncbi:hypothetical protein [Microtetraspora glauca]|uniref:Uncharacterized protein n=1 Tax=Microtetraspora glauca TaxID=1996 RepID=A0ABV3GLA2_MICGL